MALLQRTRILPQQRLDLPDYNNIEDFVCADLKAIFKDAWTSQNFVLSGFEATGIGTSDLSIAIAGSSAIVGADDGTMYIGASSLSPLTTAALTPAATNFVEIFVDQDTGGADSRAFWDQTAAAGEGGEFSQIVDTFIFLDANLAINTSSFTGDADKVAICEVDVNGSGVITAIRDSRNLFFRLGRANDTTFSFPWASRVEPTTAQFEGADKDISNLKEWADAVMSRLKENSGTTYWYESPSVSLTGLFRNTGLSVLAGLTNTARFRWTGTQLLITDASVTPADTDAIASLRLFDDSSDLILTRQDALNAIDIGDGEIVWIEIPNPLASINYSSTGLTQTNYRVSARGSVPLEDSTYWLGYREGTKLILRGLGELEAGEEKQISDETTTAMVTFLGFDPETATSVPYTDVPNSINFLNTFDTSDSLVTAISTNTANINAIGATLDANAYAEKMRVVLGVPVDDNEIQGPVLVGTNITLPLDSRDSDAQEEYIVGEGLLKIFLNGQLLCETDDWTEVGTPGDPSDTIQIQQQLEIGDVLQFRVDSNGGFLVGGGGGGGAGDVIGASNIGAGAGTLFKQKTAGILEFRNIQAGTGISVTTVGDDVIIALAGGSPEPFFRSDVTGQTVTLVSTGGTYNLGTNKLDVYRNGVLMMLTNTLGSPADRYQEASNNQVLLGLAPVASEVFTFVNQDTDPSYKQFFTGVTGTLINVPAYTQSNDSLRVWRNGVLMNAAGGGNPVDQYTETSSTTITLAQAAIASDIFIIASGPIPTAREDITGVTGPVINLSNSYNVGTDELLIYKNGILMYNSVSLGTTFDRYQESSSTSVTLEQAITVNDVITAIIK